VGEVLRLVLRVRFDEALALWQAAADGDGTEALHDLRVALRRVRAVLRTFRAEAAGRRWRAAERALRRTFRGTGPARDSEVLVQRLGAYAAGARERHSDGIEAMEARCERLHRRARPALRDALAARRRDELARRMDELLAGRLVAPAADAAPFGGPAPQRLAEVLDGAARLAADVEARARTKDLHALRIELKRVRYLAEVFEQAGPGPLADAIERLRTLQDALGDVHDLDVQMAEVMRVLRRIETRRLRDACRRALETDDPAGAVAEELDGRGPPARAGLLFLLGRMARDRVAARARALAEVGPALADTRAALGRALASFGGLAPARRRPRRSAASPLAPAEDAPPRTAVSGARLRAKPSSSA